MNDLVEYPSLKTVWWWDVEKARWPERTQRASEPWQLGIRSSDWAGAECSQPCRCQGRTVIVLSPFVPFSTSAIGSDEEPSCRSLWVGTVYWIIWENNRGMRRNGIVRVNYPTDGLASDAEYVRSASILGRWSQSMGFSSCFIFSIRAFICSFFLAFISINKRVVGRWLVCQLPLEILVDIVLELLVIELEELLFWNIAIELVIIGTSFFYMCVKNLFGCNFDFGILLLDEDISIQALFGRDKLV